MLENALVGALLALATILPLAWKWELGIRLAAGGTVALAVLCSLGVSAVGTLVKLNAAEGVGLVWLLTVALACATVAYRFYRDPDRTPPDRDDVLISPADGTVIYVHVAQKGTVPVSTKHGRSYTLHELTKTSMMPGECVVIGIAMNFLDVHVNRAPLAGRVTLQRHFSGMFGSLKRAEMVFANERSTTLIERNDLQIAVVQIASRLVRQIVSFVREGQEVGLGQRIGVIRFGSQVDVVLPARADLEILVEPGQKVRAGQSLLAALGQTATQEACAKAVPMLQPRDGAGEEP